jgi:hypothetical protein
MIAQRGYNVGQSKQKGHMQIIQFWKVSEAELFHCIVAHCTGKTPPHEYHGAFMLTVEFLKMRYISKTVSNVSLEQ